jgi:hypothetical protein
MTVFKNPFFYIPCLVFWVNQYFEKVQGIFIPFIHAYLDDLLAMPVVLGIALQVFRFIHPFKDNFIFTKVQVGIGVAYFAFLFEIVLPRWSATYTADIWDVLCYAIGAFIFYRFINITHI